MARYRQRIGLRSHVFADAKTLLAKASPLRAGDQLAGLAAVNAEERVAAQLCLAELPLRALLDEPLIPYETDEVTRLIVDDHDAAAFAPIAALSVGELRDWLLAAEPAALVAVRAGLTPEMVAATSKLMRNQDLVAVAKKCVVQTRFRSTVGGAGVLCTRLQPNHPTDDLQGIAASLLDGLLLGSGDACIGINPAGDDPARFAELWRALDALIARFGIPTQSCVLTHVTRQIEALEQGLPLDLVFQSIGGTEALNKSFGIDLALLREAREAALALGRAPPGLGPLGTPQLMYFETGQGAALSAGAHHGVDQQTCETRAYAVARAYDPLLVNSVVGFIGPEYLRDGKEIVRAGLEDHCCGKLLGLPMGVDVCYTNHADADQDDIDVLLTVLGAAGVNFVMGVPGADDVMLGYQSTSFHDALYARAVLRLKPAPEFAAWLERMGLFDAAGRPLPVAAQQAALAALRGGLGWGGGKAGAP